MNKRFAVIGYPIGHTMSPFIHNRLFAISGYSAEYEKHEIAPDLLRNNIDMLKSLNGFNITIPHKQTIIKYIDRLDRSAELYGAVNTVLCDNGLVGYNTDAFGFLSALNSADVELCGNVLICGAGGAARTVAFEAAIAGCDITISVRKGSTDKANELGNELRDKFGTNVKIIPLDEVTGSYDLCVNATPCGMYPHINDSPLTGEQIAQCKVLFDAIYNPRETKMLTLAAEKGVRCIGGMDMLVWQAVKAHEIWYGERFTRGDVAAVICDASAEMERIFTPRTQRNIVLCGFMGSGKTTVGKIIAEKLNYKFIDVDEYIVGRENMSVADIFERFGEEHFRELEHSACAELSQYENTVIATGGGAMTFNRNIDLFSKNSVIFFLDVPFETVLSRVGNDPARPMMKQNAKKLYDARRPLYFHAADIIIDENGTPAEIAQKIVDRFKKL